MRILGVDPGLDGACALRDGTEIEWVAAWTRVAAGIRLRTSGDRETVFGSIHALSRYVGTWVAPVDLVVVEGLFAPPRWSKRCSGDDFRKLAEATGEMVGPLRGPAAVLRPTAKEWRDVIGCSNADEATAERIAIDVARREGWLPRWTAKEQGAVAEAGIMTAWALRCAV